MGATAGFSLPLLGVSAVEEEWLVSGLTMSKSSDGMATQEDLPGLSEPPASCISVPENGTLSSHFG